MDEPLERFWSLPKSFLNQDSTVLGISKSLRENFCCNFKQTYTGPRETKIFKLMTILRL